LTPVGDIVPVGYEPFVGTGEIQSGNEISLTSGHVCRGESLRGLEPGLLGRIIIDAPTSVAAPTPWSNVKALYR
jgi:hypothetical protein